MPGPHWVLATQIHPFVAWNELPRTENWDPVPETKIRKDYKSAYTGTCYPQDIYSLWPYASCQVWGLSIRHETAQSWDRWHSQRAGPAYQSIGLHMLWHTGSSDWAADELFMLMSKVERVELGVATLRIHLRFLCYEHWQWYLQIHAVMYSMGNWAIYKLYTWIIASCKLFDLKWMNNNEFSKVLRLP